MIKLKKIQRKNPKTGTTAWYAAKANQGYVGLDQIVKEISAKCTCTPADVKGVLSALQEHILQSLQNNNSVRLGDLGSWHVRANSSSAETAAKLSADNVKRMRVHFCKSRAMLQTFALGNSGLKLSMPKN